MQFIINLWDKVSVDYIEKNSLVLFCKGKTLGEKSIAIEVTLTKKTVSELLIMAIQVTHWPAAGVKAKHCASGQVNCG